uniref:MAK10-like protein n=1 Tax=Tanacetum cinerariifolium TaxID=118510 RepID=A0A6L2L0R9_TANCI|nr:hypothetical protein [Tanacetum cinerariifolium]
MGDENPICTLGDYSKPSHEGYRNTIKLPVWNNVVPLRFDTIRLVQNGFSFHGLQSEDLNQHLKDFLKLVDSLNLDGENGERTRLRPTPQLRALDTTFEARVRDYMAAHTERMERFENTIFKQREEINGRMTEMFRLLKELTTRKTPEKVLIREEGKFLHKINEELIKGLVNNNRFNNSRSRTQVVKKKGKEYKILPGVPAYKVILKKMITKKEDIEGNFELPCSIGGLKHVHALIDQGSDVNVMPYSTYMKLTNERPDEADIRLLLASHSYVYPLGIAEDVLVEVAEHIYHADFVIMDIKENENRPFILGMPFLTTAKASIKFDTCTITLRSGKSKISFNRIPEPPSHVEKGIKNDIEPIAPTMTVNRLVLEWEERKILHQEKEMEFNQWRSKNFKDERPAL